MDSSCTEPGWVAPACGEAVIDEPARARIEIVETGDRIWFTYQIRDLPYAASVLVLWADSDAQVAVTVHGDGDYSIPNTTEASAKGRVDLHHADTLILTGSLEAPD